MAVLLASAQQDGVGLWGSPDTRFRFNELPLPRPSSIPRHKASRRCGVRSRANAPGPTSEPRDRPALIARIVRHRGPGPNSRVGRLIQSRLERPMLVRSALLLTALTSGAHAAAFDDVKGYLASCLRFEMNGADAQRGATPASRVRFALERCGPEFDRLERADGRRLRSDGGISPSTKAVIESVMGLSGNGFSAVRY
ncbi:hypothetical protein [Methylobacterium brachiatum]|uniref:hypothetical protein n=1 Tax=Methylobacterium brachiatum TaxID=269660 RepID=UPI001FCD2FB3|nr:hypothetical protein [Methylobacterium brachiatum]